MSKEITITVPEGKKAEWVNGVLTLIDEEVKDNRPVTERIKTFEDACNALGDEHPLVKEYWGVVNVDFVVTLDLLTYLKLRIIVAALNEGWEPKFEKGEYHYYPWLLTFTKEEYDESNDEEKERCVPHSDDSFVGWDFTHVTVTQDAWYSYGGVSPQLVFKTRELAEYAGKQFTNEWIDFMCKPCIKEQ